MKKIFLLEDDDDVADAMDSIIRYLVVNPEPEIVRAKNIQEALEILVKNSPTLDFDAAILDYNLPDGFGTELMETFRCVTPRCKIIVYSALINADPDVTRLISRHNPDYMLSKPCTIDRFSQVLRDAGLL